MSNIRQKIILSFFLCFLITCVLGFLLVRQNSILLPIFSIIVIVFCCAILSFAENLYILIVLLLTSVAFQALYASLAVSSIEEFGRISILLFEIKSFFLIGAVIGIFLNSKFRRIILQSESIYPFLLIIWACLRGIITRGDTATSLAYLRNFSSLALILGVGIAASRTIPEIKWESILIFFSLLLLLGILLEILFGRDLWWTLLNLDKLQVIKGPYSTTTDFFGFTVLRLRSFVGEPINTSYMLGSLAAWHFYKHRRSLGILFTVAVVFTFAKSGIILLFMSLAWFHVCTKRKIIHIKLFTLGAMLSALPLFVVYVNASDDVDVLAFVKNPLDFFLGNNTAFTHASGLILGVKSAITNPIGSGLGVGGNFGQIFTNSNRGDWISSGSESGIGVLAFQLGILGLLLHLIFVYRTLSKNLALMRSTNLLKSEILRKTFGVSILFGWYSASLFSENAFGPQSALIPVLIFAYYNYSVRERSTRWE